MRVSFRSQGQFLSVGPSSRTTLSPRSGGQKKVLVRRTRHVPPSDPALMQRQHNELPPFEDGSALSDRGAAWRYRVDLTHEHKSRNNPRSLLTSTLLSHKRVVNLSFGKRLPLVLKSSIFSILKKMGFLVSLVYII